jgi:hypothetical protein
MKKPGFQHQQSLAFPEKAHDISEVGVGDDQKNSEWLSNEEQMGSSNDQFDKYNNEIYDGLKLYASKESCSSLGDDLSHSVDHHQEQKPFKTEEDLSRFNSASKLLKILGAGNIEDMRSRLQTFGPI